MQQPQTRQHGSGDTVPHTATIKSIILLGPPRRDPHVSRQPMFLAFRTLIPAAIVSASLVAAQTSGPATAVSASADRETLRRYCVACHNAKVKTSGIALDSMDVHSVGEQTEAWEKVVRKL